MRSFRLLSLAFVLAVAVPACSSSGDDDTSSGKPATSEQPGTTSAAITAADGGEVKLGGASLSIPGGALADDTTVTVASSKPSADLPDANSLSGLVYDLGPTGTTFATPVALTLPLAQSPGSGKEAVIAYLNEDTGSWEDLTTTAAGGAVVADILHFSTYVVRIRNVAVDPGGEVDCSFTACGGNPVGSWKVASACISGSAGDNPFGDACPDAAIGIDLVADGTLDVTSDRYVWNMSVSGNTVITVPAGCVDSLSNGQATDCSAFADTNSTCTGSVKTGCTCTGPIDPSTQMSTGTYVLVNGDTIVGTDDGSSEAGDPTQFCVQGKTMKLMLAMSDTGSQVVLNFTQ